jgi:molybdopterin-containing oxidoreductase family iron-sulfur binding subunit
MVIDLDRCTGCGACMVACYQENNIPFKEDETEKLDSLNWIRVMELTNGKTYPNHERAFLPLMCQHCDGIGYHGHSPCVTVCPAVATDYNYNTGIVSQIPVRCFGCRYCMAACPYHTRKFNWWDPTWPADTKQYLNPDVSARMRGVVEKCTLCNHRLQNARDKAYVEGREELGEMEYQSACAQACPTGAIKFGDLSKPEHAVHKLKDHENAFRLLHRLQTNPKIYYISSKSWVRRAGDNYLKGESMPQHGKLKAQH